VKKPGKTINKRLVQSSIVDNNNKSNLDDERPIGGGNINNKIFESIDDKPIGGGKTGGYNLDEIDESKLI
jgi:hypothetical protein